MSAVTYAEVDAGVRRAIAAYVQALDDGRTDDVVATFCDDASVSIPGMGEHQGREALHAAYSRWTPRMPQRHLVLNTLISAWSDDEATASSDVVFLLREEAGWSVRIVGRYHDTLHRGDDGTWRFHRRTAQFEQ